MTILGVRGKILLWVLLLGAWCVLRPALMAQPSPQPALKILLLNAGSSGVSNAQAAFFLLSLQQKISHFPLLAVSLKGDFLLGLTKEESAAFEKCSTVQCIQPFAAAAGFRRLLLCKLTKTNTVYKFQATEYDIDKLKKISTISDTVNCQATWDVDKLTWKIARKIEQTYAHGIPSPDSLQQSKSNAWWYIGSAVGVGVAAGVYFLTLQPKESSSLPKSLPLPSDLP